MNTLNLNTEALRTLRYDVAVAVMAMGLAFGLVAKWLA